MSAHYLKPPYCALQNDECEHCDADHLPHMRYRRFMEKQHRRVVNAATVSALTTFALVNIYHHCKRSNKKKKKSCHKEESPPCCVVEEKKQCIKPICKDITCSAPLIPTTATTSQPHKSVPTTSKLKPSYIRYNVPRVKSVPYQQQQQRYR